MAFIKATALRFNFSIPVLSPRANSKCMFPRRLRVPTVRVSPRMSTSAGKLPVDKDPATITDGEWRKVLSEKEFNILRQKGTEYPGTGEYDGFYPSEGYFACRACGNPIYSAESKFKSGCGWPAFDKCYKGSVKTVADYSLGMRRTEIMCVKCNGHLGHVFEGERMTSTNERHCVNSIALKYNKGSISNEEVKVM